jgi:serine/threonine protein phosphatase PrpC
MRLLGVGWTDIGLLRRTNEDSFAVVQKDIGAERQDACYVVCDGLGGARAGEVASRVAVDTFVAVWFSPVLTAEDTTQRLRRAVQEANAAVHGLSLSSSSMAGMGTTLVALVPHAGWMYVCNVGDSRCYRLRNGILKQLTEDHTVAAEMERQGLLDRGSARDAGDRNLLTRVVGTFSHVEADVVSDELRGGDRYLLCSDGLWGTVEEADLLTALAQGTVDESAHHLVELANVAGGPDNSTAIVIEVQDA